MAVQAQVVSVAHSPDSDDAFMFYAIAKNKLNTAGFQIKQVYKDIQTLNEEAVLGLYDASAISFAAYPSICDQYALMPCGASLGYKYGPILVAKRPLSLDELKASSIAIPGRLTSAWLTLQLFMPDLNVVDMPFNQIIASVLSGDADAGLLIHEGQLTYADEGLHKIYDLGQWWFEVTGLPLPLGASVVRKSLGVERMRALTQVVKESIRYSLDHRAEALDYALEFAREMKKSVADQYIGMYVNDLTVDCGAAGREAVGRFFDMAYEKGVLSKRITPEFVEV